MYQVARLDIPAARPGFQMQSPASGVQALEKTTDGKPNASAEKIAWAIRRLALTELGHLAEGRVVLPFSVAPEMLRKPHGANWRLIIADSATDRAKRALRAAEAVLQSRWNMVDLYAGTRALVV